mmetsp:Transcript_24888/g.34420  ORF Transcript_24888/g.34420 Transcript_24888/m.34420 type:complete len:341 (+) Transcript_24888:2-1024(+)
MIINMGSLQKRRWTSSILLTLLASCYFTSSLLFSKPLCPVDQRLAAVSSALVSAKMESCRSAPNSNCRRLMMSASSKEKKIKVKKVRIDDLMIERGYAEDRKSAAAFVLAGDVFIKNDQKILTAAEKVPEDSLLRVRKRMEHGWVGRGGIKLQGGIEHFKLQKNLAGCVAIDVGCSTGGFTDVLLHHGAARVYAVDVGYSLLDYRLRVDERVAVLERTNARFLNGTHLQPGDAGAVGAVVCDASFISLRAVLPPALALCRAGAVLVALVKPQFEADRAAVGPGGVVVDPAVHAQVCQDIQEWFAETQIGWKIQGIIESPIRGADSNKEFLLCAQKSDGDV